MGAAQLIEIHIHFSWYCSCFTKYLFLQIKVRKKKWNRQNTNHMSVLQLVHFNKIKKDERQVDLLFDFWRCFASHPKRRIDSFFQFLNYSLNANQLQNSKKEHPLTLIQLARITVSWLTEKPLRKTKRLLFFWSWKWKKIKKTNSKYKIKKKN